MIVAALLLAGGTVTGVGAVMSLLCGFIAADRDDPAGPPLLVTAAVLAGIAVPLLYLFEQVRP